MSNAISLHFKTPSLLFLRKRKGVLGMSSAFHIIGKIALVQVIPSRPADRKDISVINLYFIPGQLSHMKEVDDVGTVALAESRLREHRFDIPKLLLIAQISLFGVHDDVMVIHLYIINVVFENP